MEVAMEPAPVQDAAAEIERIKGVVSRYFSVYETDVRPDSVGFHCRVDTEMLDENFSRLRGELEALGYVPIITYRGGEHIVVVSRLPKVKPRGIWVNIVLLVITIMTTIFAGIILWVGYQGESIGKLSDIDSETILMGAVTFAVPLLGVLGIHEMGHYLMARRHGIPASLPFFIPAPPFFPLGTFGAFISLRGPMPNRKTLFDIGIAGPICGFFATIPVLVIGLILSGGEGATMPEETGGMWTVMTPLIYDFVSLFLPISGEYTLHPTAFAAWVGFLVTAINLLPAGSLDGGHIARAALGPDAKYISWAAVLVLFVLSFFYIGWAIFALLILFLGLNHSPPLNDITKIDRIRKAVGVGMVAMLAISFAPIPISVTSYDYGFEAELVGSDSANLSAAMSHTFMIVVNSTGNMNVDLMFDISSEEDISELDYYVGYNGFSQIGKDQPVVLHVEDSVMINFTMLLDVMIAADREVNVSIDIYAQQDDRFRKSIDVNITEVAGSLECVISPAEASAHPSDEIEFSIYLNSSSAAGIEAEIAVDNVPYGWDVGLYINASDNMTDILSVHLSPFEELLCTLLVNIGDAASPGSEAEIRVTVNSDFAICPPQTVVITVL
ncbi:MAG TPA: site-2 protease family protein [Euryarchaeota archaeon]|nr:site-2 protease family protein [Euryarchaeota archaeon]